VVGLSGRDEFGSKEESAHNRPPSRGLFHSKKAFAVFKDRIETIEVVQRLRIPTSMIASVAGVSAPRVSDFLCHRNLNCGTSQRIQEAAQKIAAVWQSFQEKWPGLRIFLHDPQQLETLYQACSSAKIQEQLAELSEVTQRSFGEAFSESE
jgi:hypothetical protein